MDLREFRPEIAAIRQPYELWITFFTASCYGGWFLWIYGPDDLDGLSYFIFLLTLIMSAHASLNCFIVASIKMLSMGGAVEHHGFQPRYILPARACVSVRSCSWSSTSSRRKSAGWESSSTRETCASSSWSWRLRTWKTLSLRPRFKSRLADNGTLGSSRDHTSLYKLTARTSFPSALAAWGAGRSHTSTLCFPFYHSLSVPTKCARTICSCIYTMDTYPTRTCLTTLCTCWTFFHVSFVCFTAMQVYCNL